MTEEKTQSNVRARPPHRIIPPAINWPLLLSDIEEHGCSLYRVSLHVGVCYSTAQGWKRVKDDIGYGYGRALIRVHSMYCGAALTFQRLTESEP